MHVFNPTQPVTQRLRPRPATAGCPLLIINQDAERLEKMAELGGGDFRDFRNNEPINFLNFRFGQVRRAFVLKELVASNFSAPPGSPAGRGGHATATASTDAQELELGTDPLKADTDGDGFTDGVEVHFAALGARLQPRPGARCPTAAGSTPAARPRCAAWTATATGCSTATSRSSAPTPRSSTATTTAMPDSVEWQLGTQASSKDLDAGSGQRRGDEPRRAALHTNPLAGGHRRRSA